MNNQKSFSIKKNCLQPVSRRHVLKQMTGAAAVLPVVASATGPFISCSPNRRKTPNIIVIYPDQLRQDTLGAYGGIICQTPAIDRRHFALCQLWR